MSAKRAVARTKTTAKVEAKKPKLKAKTVAVKAKKTEPKKAEPKKPEPKKAEPKKVEAKKVEPKRADAKKAEPKKAEAKAEPKKAEKKKTESKKTESPQSSRIGTATGTATGTGSKKKVEPKKIESKAEAKKAEPKAKIETKKVEPKKADKADKAEKKPEVPPPAEKKAAAKKAAKPATPPDAPAAPKEPVMKQNEAKSETPVAALPAKSRNVLRIAAGERRPKAIKDEEAAREANNQNVHPALRTNGPVKTIRRTGAALNQGSGARKAPQVEINPKLESSKSILGPNEGSKEKPMSVAQKNRAAAEAAFFRVAPEAAAHREAPPRAPTPPPAAPPPAHTNGVVSNGAANGPGQPHKSTFEMRISERDTLTSTLRFSESRDAALEAARELAQRFRLPPDQTLLVRVIGLNDPALSKLALEELLELDDRGRVRRTPDLREALDKLKSEDRETIELKDLLLEKIGAFGG